MFFGRFIQFPQQDLELLLDFTRIVVTGLGLVDGEVLRFGYDFK
jgi:hypothetical protein